MSIKSMLDKLPTRSTKGLSEVLLKAAVNDSFDLSLAGGDTQLSDRLVARSKRLDSGRYRLQTGIRTATLSGRERAQLASLVDKNAPQTQRQVFLYTWLSGKTVDLDILDESGLRLALQVLDWLSGVEGLLELPDQDEILARLLLYERRAGFRDITHGFVDRTSSMRRLHRHVGELGKPLVVYGAGGSGKSSLLARFLSDMDARGLPWVHLDLDDPAVDLQEPGTVIAEAIRQLSAHRPEVRFLVQSLTIRLQSHTVSLQTSQELQWEDLTDLLTGLARGAPIVIAVDTFEEAQTQTPKAALRLARAMQRVSSIEPLVRVVFFGRAPVSGLFRHKLADLPLSYAVELIRRPPGLTKGATRELLKRTGTLPLTVRLVGRTLEQNPDLAELQYDLDKLGARVDQDLYQGFVYTRVLGHMDAQVPRKLAELTLMVPAFNEELVREVLAPKAQVPVEQVADAVVQLSRERGFVQRVGGTSGWYRHRGDLRGRAVDLLDQQERSEIQTLTQEWLENAQLPPSVEKAFEQDAWGVDFVTETENLAGRAEFLLGNGEPERVLELLQRSRSAELVLLRARALWQSNRVDESKRQALSAYERGDQRIIHMAAMFLADFHRVSEPAVELLARLGRRTEAGERWFWAPTELEGISGPWQAADQVCWSPSGAHLAVLKSGTVFVSPSGRLSHMEALPDLDGGSELGWSRDGRELWVLRGGDVAVVELQSLQIELRARRSHEPGSWWKSVPRLLGRAEPPSGTRLQLCVAIAAADPGPETRRALDDEWAAFDDQETFDFPQLAARIAGWSWSPKARRMALELGLFRPRRAELEQLAAAFEEWDALTAGYLAKRFQLKRYDSWFGALAAQAGEDAGPMLLDALAMVPVGPSIVLAIQRIFQDRDRASHRRRSHPSLEHIQVPAVLDQDQLHDMRVLLSEFLKPRSLERLLSQVPGISPREDWPQDSRERRSFEAADRIQQARRWPEFIEVLLADERAVGMERQIQRVLQT